MEIKDYISSGKLELYVYGVLPESESAEITRVLREHPEIKAEVDEIETALVSLSAGAAPKNPEHLLMSIMEKISNKDRQIPAIGKRSHWREYAGWAASILLLIGMFVLYNENQELERSLRASQIENAQMEERIVEARENTEKTRDLLEVLRDRNIRRVPLPGTETAPEAYAVAYWNEDENTTYIDAQELPEPPRGMVYQVWSLKLNPLAATSIGILEDFTTDRNKIFKLSNENLSEGFGITLEPEGGSETPTLENLYSMGVVSI